MLCCSIYFLSQKDEKLLKTFSKADFTREAKKWVIHPSIKCRGNFIWKATNLTGELNQVQLYFTVSFQWAMARNANVNCSHIQTKRPGRKYCSFPLVKPIFECCLFWDILSQKSKIWKINRVDSQISVECKIMHLFVTAPILPSLI